MNIQQIFSHFEKNEKKLNTYWEQEFKKTPPLLYLSCDLRHSGNKVSVIDTNLFPAGFNNLCKAFTTQSMIAFQDYLHKNFPQAKKILIYPEAHTRNKFYFKNLHRLAEILSKTGVEVQIGLSSTELGEDPLDLQLEEENALKLHPLKKENHLLKTLEGWAPDLVISNNDFSNGVDPVLQDITQPLIPPVGLGWYRRKKSRHFHIYNEVAAEIGELLDLDPWLISSLSTSESEVDLNDPASLKRLAQTVDQTLATIQKKYDQYQISSPPYVFIKNNSGTYGMGLAYVMSGEEVMTMNRKMRTKLTSTKGGKKADEFLIQEGVITADFYSGYPIEPVIYMVGENPIGGFFRLNEEKDEWSSLNTKGMAFSCLCLHKLDQPHEEPFLKCVEKQTLVKISFELAKVAALAAAREAKI